MSQAVFGALKRKPTATATTDGDDLKEAARINKSTAADSLAALEEAVKESDKFRDDFLKTLAESDQRVKAIRRIAEKGWITYEEETKLSDEEKTRRSVLRRKIDANLNIRKLAEGCCFW